MHEIRASTGTSDLDIYTRFHFSDYHARRSLRQSRRQREDQEIDKILIYTGTSDCSKGNQVSQFRNLPCQHRPSKSMPN